MLKNEKVVKSLQDDANEIVSSLQTLVDQAKQMGLYSLCQNAVKLWEDLRVLDDLEILTNFIDKLSDGNKKKADAQKMKKTLEGNVGTTVDDQFSRLKQIEGVIETESNIKSLSTYLQTLSDSVNKQYPKTKKERDAVLDQYKELIGRDDIPGFISAVNAEITTVQKNLDDIFDNKVQPYQDFLEAVAEIEHDMTDFVSTVQGTLDDIAEKDCRNDLVDLNNEIDNCDDDTYDDMNERWQNIKENTKNLLDLEKFLFSEVQKQNFLTKGRGLIDSVTFLKTAIEFLHEQADKKYK